METRSMSYEDLAERALPSGLVAVRHKLGGMLRRPAVNIHCKSASGKLYPATPSDNFA